jgi:hypothetical protein
VGVFIFIGMEKVFLNKTYGYKNFITENEKNTLINWVDENLQSFRIHPTGPKRRNRRIKIEDSIHTLVMEIKSRVIQLENIENWEEEPEYGDYIGVNFKGGFIHSHQDPNKGELTHTRWNLILSYPDLGGHSIYNGEINVLEENMIWKCVAGKYTHGSTVVESEKKRITLSLGFLI